MTHAAPLLPAEAGIELRLIDVHDLPPDALRPACPQESRRAARFRFARHRDRYLAGRCLLRRMLADWSGLPPEGLRFTTCGKGKPVLLDRPDLHFNLSYSGETILIGVTMQGRLGVDLEQRRPFPDARALAESCFDPAEQIRLAQAESAGQESDLFLCGWTRKEACLKAAALGLAHDPARVSTGLDIATRDVAIARTLHARVTTLPAERHFLSWAYIV